MVQSSGPSGRYRTLSWRELGDKLFDIDTPLQSHSLPPTIPPASGTVPPLQYQLALPFEPVMVEVILPSGNKLLHYDFAETESRVAAAFRYPYVSYPTEPEPWRNGELREGAVVADVDNPPDIPYWIAWDLAAETPGGDGNEGC